MEDPLNIIVTGVGGQGNIQASYIIASAAVREGFYVSVGETYGAAQRGGSVTSHIRISMEMQYGPLIPRGKAHIIVGFEPVECLRTIGDFGNKKSMVIINPRPIYPIDVLSGEATYPSIDNILNVIKELVQGVYVVEATELAKKAGDAILQNVVMVGCLSASGFIPLRVETFKATIAELFAEKSLSLNLKAFEIGVEEFKRVKPL
ncbi:MAG: indolepyruvate oxidoreductase subunit beta [Candidatus Bathyarchaeia archaeon]